jgi:hypothetical protein
MLAHKHGQAQTLETLFDLGVALAEVQVADDQQGGTGTASVRGRIRRLVVRDQGLLTATEREGGSSSKPRYLRTPFSDGDLRRTLGHTYHDAPSWKNQGSVRARDGHGASGIGCFEIQAALAQHDLEGPILIGCGKTDHGISADREPGTSRKRDGGRAIRPHADECLPGTDVTPYNCQRSFVAGHGENDAHHALDLSAGGHSLLHGWSLGTS